MVGFIFWAVTTFGRKLGEDVRYDVARHNVLKHAPPEARDKLRSYIESDREGFMRQVERNEAEIFEEARRIEFSRRTPLGKARGLFFHYLWIALWVLAGYEFLRCLFRFLT